MRKKLEVKCSGCDQLFLKSNSEIKRNKSGKHFCNSKCYGKECSKYLPSPPKGIKPKNFVGYTRKDQFSSFKSLFNTAKAHSKTRKKEFTISLNDLKSKWEEQEGKCPYTGWTLLLAETTKISTEKIPCKVSLDRINSNEGYVPGNIQFISMIANYAKNEWDDNCILEFAAAVVQHHQTKKQDANTGNHC